MPRNKHVYPLIGPGFRPAKHLTRPGRRRARRRLQLLMLAESGFANGDTLKETFQAGARLAGATLADRRWLWSRLKGAA